MRKNILENIQAKQERERLAEIAEMGKTAADAKQYVLDHPEIWNDVYRHYTLDMNGDIEP